MKLKFENNGKDFSGIYAAEEWARSNGYVIGSMEREHPIGLAPADEYSGISKWTKMTSAERDLLAGKITCDVRGFRHGTATVEIFER